MSTLAVTNLKHESATGNNIVLDSSGNVAFADGSASAPSITNDGDTNTGIYFPAADNIGFATNGVIRGRWTTDGLCFGSDTAAANALDDYEEGTWTTTFSAATNLTGTPSLSVATYTKIGRLVYIQGKVTGYSVTASNTLTGFVATLPINMATNTDPSSSGIYVGIGGVSCAGFATDNSSGNATEIFIGLSSVNVLGTGAATFQIALTYITTA